jgi:plasmid stability protein
MGQSGRLTVTLPEELKREARVKAIKEGTNLSELAREWLAAYIRGDWSPKALKLKGET